MRRPDLQDAGLQGRLGSKRNRKVATEHDIIKNAMDAMSCSVVHSFFLVDVENDNAKAAC